MPKYLYRGAYSADGTKGLLRDGALKRRETVTRLVEGLGGKVDVFTYAFGEDDVVIVMDLPDNVTAAAIAMTVGASGAVKGNVTVLISPEEVERAGSLRVTYSAPGQ